MNRIYLANAFSLNMVSRGYHRLVLHSLTTAEAAALLYVAGAAVVNAIGHPDTHYIAERLLKFEVPALELPEPQRMTVKLDAADAVVVAQYSGPRLEPGTTVLPEGAQLEFWLVVGVDRVHGHIVEELMKAYAAGWQNYTSQTTPAEATYIHWAALKAMRARAAEVHPYASDVLEALRQVERAYLVQ